MVVGVVGKDEDDDVIRFSEVVQRQSKPGCSEHQQQIEQAGFSQTLADQRAIDTGRRAARRLGIFPRVPGRRRHARAGRPQRHIVRRLTASPVVVLLEICTRNAREFVLKSTPAIRLVILRQRTAATCVFSAALDFIFT